MSSNAMEQAASAIRNADALLIGAGAGMGVDSGLPDFRGNEGFWRAYPPFKERGLSFYDLANPIWFHQDPQQAWGFYGHRLNLYRTTVPHEGFTILCDFADRLSDNHFVFTSNVDGQFQASGFDDDRIVECHGSICHLQCANTCCARIWPANDLEIQIDETSFLAQPPLPKCEECGGAARPNILMFSDASWLGQRTEVQHSRYQRWIEGLPEGTRFVAIELGAGSAIPTVRWEMEHRTRGVESTLIRINPRECDVVDGISIESGARDALVEIAELLK